MEAACVQSHCSLKRLVCYLHEVLQFLQNARQSTEYLPVYVGTPFYQLFDQICSVMLIKHDREERNIKLLLVTEQCFVESNNVWH